MLSGRCSIRDMRSACVRASLCAAGQSAAEISWPPRSIFVGWVGSRGKFGRVSACAIIAATLWGLESKAQQVTALRVAADADRRSSRTPGEGEVGIVK